MVVNVPLLVLGWRVLGVRSLVYTIWARVACRCPSGSAGGSGSRSTISCSPRSPRAWPWASASGSCSGSAARRAASTSWRGCCRSGSAGGWPHDVLRDVGVIGVSLIFLRPEQAMYTVVAVFVGTRIIDLVQDAAYSAGLTIVSVRADEIARRIMDELGRGVTRLRGQGAYTGASARSSTRSSAARSSPGPSASSWRPIRRRSSPSASRARCSARGSRSTATSSRSRRDLRS